MDMTEDFLSQIKAKGYWKAGEKVIVGVSGGIDSMVLFDLLNQLPQDYKPAIVVAHINHHLRSESDEEERFIKKWMQQYHVPVFVHQWPKSEHPDSGFEQEARKVRYRFFNEVAQKTGSHHILTAHHRDDQVETVLMRFVKGSSIEELTGIVESRKAGERSVIRPLLPYSKEMITDYAERNAISWREDESNLSLAYTRNRYRHQIIPELKKENPALEQHIYDFSKEIEDLLKAIEPLINEELRRSFQINRSSLTIDLSSFLKQEIGFQKIVLRRAFKILSGQDAYIVSQAHINVLIDWFKSGGPNTELNLPHRYTARKEYDMCCITKSDSNSLIDTERDHTQRTLELDQWVHLGEDEKIGLFSFETFKKMSRVRGQVVYLNDDHIEKPLIARHRNPGDRMKIKGMNGSKKIKDIFIDKKTPKHLRDEAWIVTDTNGQIIWLVNYKESPLSLNPLTDTISYVLVYEKVAMQD